MFFVLDEYSDVDPEHGVQEMIGIVTDALTNPHKTRPGGEIFLGEMARQ